MIPSSTSRHAIWEQVQLPALAASLRPRKCYWVLYTMNPPALTADVICEWTLSNFLADFANQSKKYQKSEFHGLIIY